MELRELQKQEAIRRIEIMQKAYKIHPNVLTEFKQDETIYYSERVNRVYDGVLYWIKNKSEFEKTVKEVENKYNIYVYHAILNHTEFGDWLSMLFVSDNPDNWAGEKSKLMVGFPKAYVYDFGGYGSEFGDIEIAGKNGGLTRVN